MDVRVIALAIRPKMMEGDLESINCLQKHRILSFLHSICKYAVCCPEAKWWIENRDTPTSNLIVPAYQACLKHFQQTKPFG